MSNSPHGHEVASTRLLCARSIGRLRILIFVLVALITANAAAEAAGAEASKPFFSCDFESPEWYLEWGERQTDERVETVASDEVRKFVPHDGKALRVRVDQGGHYGTSISFRFREQTGQEPEAVFFRYYLRFADDWDPARGGIWFAIFEHVLVLIMLLVLIRDWLRQRRIRQAAR